MKNNMIGISLTFLVIVSLFFIYLNFVPFSLFSLSKSFLFPLSPFPLPRLSNYAYLSNSSLDIYIILYENCGQQCRDSFKEVFYQSMYYQNIGKANLFIYILPSTQKNCYNRTFMKIENYSISFLCDEEAAKKIVNFLYYKDIFSTAVVIVDNHISFPTFFTLPIDKDKFDNTITLKSYELGEI